MTDMSNITTTKDDLLVVIDMQNDFVTGPLGTKEAETIVPKIAAFIKDFNGKRVYTQDTHHSDYLNTQEGENLPIPHCIKGYPGWEIVPEIKDLITEQDTMLTKPIFGSLKLLDMIRQNKYNNIYLVGVCTGICVINNAVLAKTANPEAKIHVIKDLCACVTPETHEQAINIMKLFQINIL